jgi:agmatine deiminase
VYGHSDGIVKYAGDGKVLMSNIAQDDEGKDIAKGIRKELERKGLDVVELHFDEKDPAFTYSWAYINFIQVGNVILMPALGTEQDDSAEEQISALFPSCRIHRIKDMKRVLNLGGALHCISWNIKE